MTEATGTPLRGPQYDMNAHSASQANKKGAEGSLAVGEHGQELVVTHLPANKQGVASQVTHQNHIAARGEEVSHAPMMSSGKALSPPMPKEYESSISQHQVSTAPNGKSDDVNSVVLKILPSPDEEHPQGIAKMSQEESDFWGSFLGSESKEEPSAAAKEHDDFFASFLASGNKEEPEAVAHNDDSAWASFFGEDSKKEKDPIAQESDAIWSALGKLNISQESLGASAGKIKDVLSLLDKDEKLILDKDEKPIALTCVIEVGNMSKMFKSVDALDSRDKIDSINNPIDLKETKIVEVAGYKIPINTRTMQILLPVQAFGIQGISDQLRQVCLDNGLDSSNFSVGVLRTNDFNYLLENISLRLFEDTSKVGEDKDNDKDRLKEQKERPIETKSPKIEVKERDKTDEIDELKKYELKIGEIGNKTSKTLSELTAQESAINQERMKKKEEARDELKHTIEKQAVEKEEIGKGEKRKEEVKTDTPPKK